MDYREHLTQDKGIVGGATVFKGTRVTLRTVLASLADGDSFEQILQAFPSLTKEHIQAAVAFAAASAIEDQPILSAPNIAG